MDSCLLFYGLCTTPTYKPILTSLESDEGKESEAKSVTEESGEMLELAAKPEVLAANRQYYVGGLKMQRQSTFLITMLASQNKVRSFSIL